MKNNVLFDFGDFEITKRELIASISIIAILLIIGFGISNVISNKISDKNLKYDQALHITDKDMFVHGMNTDVGNAFVYGKLECVDTVTYDEIGGEYMYIEKVKEKYTMHTRTVTHSNGKGGTYTTTETYWTWDRVGSEDKICKKIKFLDVCFNSNKIDIPNTDYIDTINESSHIRYQYYGVQKEYVGTLFTDLRKGTISDNSDFYKNQEIDETIDKLESNAGLVVFWILWIILIVGCTIGFYYLDNNYLED